METDIVQSKVITFQTIRIRIDKDWSIDDFSLLFNSINKLYGFYTIINQIELNNAEAKTHGFPFISRGNIPDMVENFVSFSTGNVGSLSLVSNKIFPLKVKQIKYSSPGVTDFAGISGILGHFKDILFHFFPDEKTKMETAILKQQKDKLMIENLQKLEIEPYLIKQIYLYEEININNIRSLIDRKKVTSIEILKNDTDSMIVAGMRKSK